MKQFLFAAPLLLVFVPATALAHDYWLAPTSYRLKAPAVVDVSLFVGESLNPEEERVLERSRYPRAEVLSTTESLPLFDPRRPEGKKPIFSFTPVSQGGHLLVVDRNASTIEMHAAKFEDYLKHEGLGHIIEARAKRGESKIAGRERYSRCLKALVQVGDARDDVYAKRSGQTLEIIPRSNPAFVKPGDVLEARVEFRGRPLPGVQFEAVSLVRGRPVVDRYSTDGNGSVQIDIKRGGVWLLRLVHMVRCEGCQDLDWESFWSAYTFSVEQ